MPRRRAPLVLALVLALVVALAACSGPSSSSFTSVRGTVADSDAFVLGVGLFFISDDAFASSAGISPSAIFEPEPGIYFSGLAPVDGDGGFTLALPSASEMPADALLPADEFLLNLAGVPDCALVADVAAARVSVHAFEFLTFPGFYAVSLEQGFGLALASDAAFDVTAPTQEELLGGRRVVSWLFADRAVSVTALGAGCTTPGGTLAVDLELSAGWNQVAWSLDANLTSFTLANAADIDPVVLTPLPMMF